MICVVSPRKVKIDLNQDNWQIGRYHGKHRLSTIGRGIYGFVARKWRPLLSCIVVRIAQQLLFTKNLFP
jgi:hypothetical protein